MIGVEIDKQAMANILKRIDPKYAEQALQTTIADAGKRGRKLAQNYLKPEDNNRGADYAPKSMRYDVKPLEATVYSVMPERRARSIEDGRPPGETVHIKAIYRWYNGTLYVRNTTIDGLSGDERAVMYRIQKRIKQTGARGKRFIAKTWEKLTADMPNQLDKIAAKLEKRWRG